MSVISGWIRDILLVVLLGWVLEMFVPAEHMRGYVKLVIGLLVMLAIFHPFLSLIGTPLKSLLPEAPHDNIARYLKEGTEMRVASEQKVLRDYKARLAKQAETVARSVPWVGSASARVQVDTTRSDAAFGTVTSVTIAVSPAKIEIPTVHIGGPPTKAATPPPKVRLAVQNRVGAALDLPPSHVRVVLAAG